MSVWQIDFETHSHASIKDTGAFRYAVDPSTEILLLAIAKDDGEVELWDKYASDEANAPALKLIDEMLDDDGIIVAHNYKFELAIIEYCWFDTFERIEPKRSRFRCTQTMANIAAIPSSLEKCGEFLGLNDVKDKRGSALIKIFSVPKKQKGKPDTRITPATEGKVTVAGVKMTAPEAWALFGEYCRQDVKVQRLIYKQLLPLDVQGATLDAFLLDMEMCMRGVPVNLPAVRFAKQVILDYNEKIAAEFFAVTGLNWTQREKVLAWLQERGYPGADLTAPTVSLILTGSAVDEDGEELEDQQEPQVSKMTPEAEKALRLRSLLTFAAVKKIFKMEDVACPDGRIRGMVNFWGAARTGRSSSNFVQLQNMRKATVEDTAGLYAMICKGQADAQVMEAAWGPPMECLASCIRHFIDLGEGKQMMGADLSQVESRVLAWLSGHQVKLKAFRDGLDYYKVAAQLLWGTPYAEVQKEERQLGKICELSLGFQGGPGALLRMAQNYGMEVTKEKAKEVVKLFKQGNEPIAKLWKAAGNAAVEAITKPGTWVTINSKLRIGVDSKLGFKCMVLELPSKRHLHYPLPEIKEIYKIKNHDTDEWREIPKWRAFDADGEKHDGVWVIQEISYYGKLEGKQIWGRVTTHGGSIVQNSTQAVAGDLMWHGGVTAERAGLKCLFPVHDEQLTEYHPENGDTPEKLAACMKALPDWAKDFPTDAVGGIYDYYTKD